MSDEKQLYPISRDNTSNSKSNQRISPTFMESMENIKVLVRMRPPVPMEAEETCPITIHDHKTLSVINNDNTKSFQCSYDAVLGPGSTQTEVYEVVKECTQSVLQGVNATIFAYGQTGSGKTYSMYGPNMETMNEKGELIYSIDNEGVIPRTIQDIFDTGNQEDMISFNVYCSFVQIYNENLYDMLRDASMMNSLPIREDDKEIYVQGLSEYQVKTVADMLNLLQVSEENRAIRETHMNQFSSRSHSLFQILIEQKRFALDGGEIELRSKFNLVDLAGSEKWNMKAVMRDEHITEMNNINLSLHTLGRCIAALAARDKKSDSHIPYRDSKLTRLLQDSLGGNSKTFLIATISPAKSNTEESISTLKFADRAKQVMIQARVNEVRPIDHALVLKLQREVEYLKELLRRFVDPLALQGINLSPNTPMIPSIPHTSSISSHILSSSTGNTGNLTNSSSSVQPLEGETSFIAEVHEQIQDRLYHVEKERAMRLKAENDKLRSDLLQAKQQLQLLLPSEEKLQSIRQSMELSKSMAISQNSSQNSIKYRDSTDFDTNKSNSKSQTMEKSSDGSISFINGLKEAWIGQTNRFWDRFDQMEKILNKFFRFEIEEDDMKAQISNLMSSTHQLREELVVPEILLKRLLNNYHQFILLTVASTSVPPSTQSNPRPIHQPTQQKPQPQPQLQSQSSSSSSVIHPSITIPSNALSQSLTNKSHIHVNSSSSNSNSNLNVSKEQVMVLGSSDSSKMRNPIVDVKSSSYPDVSNSNNNNISFMSNTPTIGIFQRQQQYLENHIQKNNVNTSSDVNTNVNTNVNLSNIGTSANTSYRPQGNKTNSNSNNTISTNMSLDQTMSSTITDEEAKIENELRQTERKMRRQQEMQGVLRQRQEKQIAMQRAEEEQKNAKIQSDQIKEQKRQQRAERLKKQLFDYENRIKTEARQMEALKRLGIDPASIM